MCNESDLAKIFGRFAGRTVTLSAQSSSRILADENDPTLTAIQNVAVRHGYTLRLVRADSPLHGESDYDPRRANIRIEHCPEGKFRIGTCFHIG